MNITQNIRQLELLGFSEDTLDRAIALAGADRLAYQLLHQAVTDGGLTPLAAVQSLESGTLKEII